MAIVGYIRVSTDKQNTEHQKFEIKLFAHKQDINIDQWVKPYQAENHCTNESLENCWKN